MGAGCWLKFYMKTFCKLKLYNFQAFFLLVHFEYFESKLPTMTMDETPQPYCKWPSVLPGGESWAAQTFFFAEAVVRVSWPLICITTGNSVAQRPNKQRWEIWFEVIWQDCPGVSTSKTLSQEQNWGCMQEFSKLRAKSLGITWFSKTEFCYMKCYIHKIKYYATNYQEWC